ncbi:cytidylate kinase [Evansella caseinilytica]|uniref:Cytidylate kinase n=1 Tax=Evansella caseinilytica TaxID=1503961 RepID=A0A1H3NC45_9BACI|nr:(d)CMP kinase [Evansella caseinilytica]SDY86313.1 cytidylate kinase [Evansella caseinilytica]
MKKQINIAIDGPAGAGKSTVAKLVAEKLSYIYIDTGAMYRSLTYKAISNGVDVNDGKALLNLLNGLEINLINKNGKQLIVVNDADVTEEIRTPAVTNQVSYVAKHSEIRREMVKRQQQLANIGGTVMDGRDIGTHVLPDAEVKVFLTASVDERARRRHEEQLAKGQQSNLEILKEEIRRRDKIDSEREVAPLVKAEDAVEINSTAMKITEVVEAILSLVNEREATKQ